MIFNKLKFLYGIKNEIVYKVPGSFYILNFTFNILHFSSFYKYSLTKNPTDYENHYRNFICRYLINIMQPLYNHGPGCQRPHPWSKECEITYTVFKTL